MNWMFVLTPEERHLAKVADLDALQTITLSQGDEIKVGMAFERIFAALYQRAKIPRETVLEWGRRYISWANSFTDRDPLPILGTEWARWMFEIATSLDRLDLALSVTKTMMCAYPPEKERRWWQKQEYKLTRRECA